MKFDLTIRRDWDSGYKPKIDRLLPSHPMNVKGHLPYWYLRTRFTQYGTSDYDLPLRGVKRIPDFGEALFIHRSKVDALGTTYFGLGAVLPYAELFFNAFWDLDFTKDELVRGDKKDPDAPWAFRYFDDYPVNLERGIYFLSIIFLSTNGYGKADVELYSDSNNQPGLLIQSGTIKKDEKLRLKISTTGKYHLRIITGSEYAHKLEKYSPLADPDLVLAYSLERLGPEYTGPLIRVRRSSDNQERDVFDINDSAFVSWLGASTAFVSRWYNQSKTGLNAYNTNSPRLPILDRNNREIIFNGTDANFDLFYIEGGNKFNTPIFSCIGVYRILGNNFNFSGHNPPIYNREVLSLVVQPFMYDLRGWNIYSSPSNRSTKPNYWEFWTGRGKSNSFDYVYGTPITFGKDLVAVERNETESIIYTEGVLRERKTCPYAHDFNFDSNAYIGYMNGAISHLILSSSSEFLALNQELLQLLR